MVEDSGQDVASWTDSWRAFTPQSEIQKWDYYGLRHWVLKYVPRYGKVIEAGCGLGRYVFYLHRLGIDIDGVDFSKEIILGLNEWQEKNAIDANFAVSDVKHLPYRSNSASGYISLGVVEHFLEGPHVALKEGLRILRPGGIAIVTTPSKTPYICLRSIRSYVKRLIKKIILHRTEPIFFFQHYYRPSKLKEFMENAGFKVVCCSGADILYFFNEMCGFSFENKIKKAIAFWLANKFENTPFSVVGAQAVTVSVKLDARMYCFLCGQKNATEASLTHYTVPVCSTCNNTPLASLYITHKRAKYDLPYMVDPPLKPPMRETCEFCGRPYTSNALFEDFGFSIKICTACRLKKPTNIYISNRFVKPIWRRRRPSR